jgi:protoheme IX farnesyltransferase
MSVTGSPESIAGKPLISTPVLRRVSARAADYLRLTKPRIAVMALLTVVIGYVLGSAGQVQIVPLLHALFGIALVAAGSSALNQWIEQDRDRLMQRTVSRPLPAGRLASHEALLFGLATGLGGLLYLAWASNLLTVLFAATTLVMYVAIYTPLKSRTALCTAVGAIPGALPPVLGWTAAGGAADMQALTLFSLLFLWQFPHFLAIAWLYRHDYEQAGFRMLPAASKTRHVTGLLAVAYATALIPVSLLPAEFVLAGPRFTLAAIALGLMYLLSAIRFLLDESSETARALILTSVIYLPLILIAMTWDHFQLLR